MGAEVGADVTVELFGLFHGGEVVASIARRHHRRRHHGLANPDLVERIRSGAP
ncbi:hypothetical protein [Streptomyces akebiae]|uniref:Uncharacterized protein n=1 Tax=Streptomyces akebiae TaxID=2865673 RepID=A0ABX8XJ75_9ACTN|nr:hypothetical protein [Streptomyces akebiae]QYX75648.1 hypothetical protein K1J60_03160 [Streptomyces akebiae]